MPPSNMYRRSVEHNFAYFVRDRAFSDKRNLAQPGRQSSRHPRSLGEYIYSWLRFGDAIAVTGGRHEYFLEAVIIIMDAYHRDPSIIDFDDGEPSNAVRESRRVEQMIDFDDDQLPLLDPRMYHRFAQGYDPGS